VYTDDLGTQLSETEIPADMQDAARIAREKLFDQLSLVDSEFEELYLAQMEGGEITPDQIRAAIRRATISNSMVAVLCGWLILGLERCRLARDVVRISPERQQTKRGSTIAGESRSQQRPSDT